MSPSSVSRHTATMPPTIPTLTTERLILEPLGPEHLSFELTLDSDAAVMTHLLGRPRTATEIQSNHDHRVRLTRDTSQPNLGYWIAFIKPSNHDDFSDSATEHVPIGIFMLLPPKDIGEPCDAELGYRLAAKFWRRGFATEGSRAVLDFAFRGNGIHVVCAQALVANEGSWKTMEKLGMRRARVFMWDYMADVEREWVEYVISRDERG